MVYFDSDVWINSIVRQNETRHKQSNRLIRESGKQGYVISLLNIQEILFVLGKLKVEPGEIAEVLNDLLLLEPKSHQGKQLKRAGILADRIGYRHINDCLHTAIAEEHSNTLITYNKKDFQKLQAETSLEIIIL